MNHAWKAVFVILFMNGVSLGLAYADTAERQQAPGTSVSLQLPKDYEESNFAGFVSQPRQSILTIVEAPAQYSAEAYDDLIKNGLAYKKMVELGCLSPSEKPQILPTKSKDTLTVFDCRLPGKVHKWMALLYKDHLVTINLQMQDNQENIQQAEQILQSVQWEKSATLDEQVEALPFRYQAAAPFETDSTAMGTIAMMKPVSTGLRDGSLPDVTISYDCFTDVSTLSDLKILNRYYQTTTNRKLTDIVQNEQNELDGFPADILRATLTKTNKTQQDFKMNYQSIIALDDRSCVINIFSETPVDDGDKYNAAIQKIVGSFKMKTDE